MIDPLNLTPEPRVVYAVFAAVRGGVSYDYLAVYATHENAQSFVDAQSADLQGCLSIWPLHLDRHPTDEFWKTPEGAVVNNEEGERTLGRLLVEILQGGELLPDDAVAAIEAARSDERDVAALKVRIVELERANELLGKIVISNADVAADQTTPALEVVERLKARKPTEQDASRSLADLGEEILAVVRGEREMPPARRAMLETPVARERFLSQLAQVRNGADLDLHVCDRLTTADEDRLRQRISALTDLDAELRRVWEMPLRDEVADRIARYRPQLERLAADEEYARVCGQCGRAISQVAGYVEQSPLSHTHFPGTCDVCGHVGSVSPSEDWIGKGD